ncbi:MAG: hypothetical protein NZM25_09650 [Leptospiraceae bacterium]|nr:hypothetical protein [Leptospiraceae bacterium]MDW8306422.1 hypothetical protein [Leptospiraceae bacterium]
MRGEKIEEQISPSHDGSTKEEPRDTTHTNEKDEPHNILLQKYKEAFFLFEAGKNNEAFALLEEVLSQAKKEDPLFMRLKYLYFLEKAKNRALPKAEFFEENEKTLLALSDGYVLCQNLGEKFQECQELEKRLLEKSWGKKGYILAKIRLSRLYLQEKNYDRAHELLLGLLEENKNNLTPPIDYAWFLLGQLYEEDPHRRNIVMARKAYEKVLRIQNSLLREKTREHLKRLNF